MISQEVDKEQELQLMERIADGDEHAFEALFNIYVPRLYPVIDQIVHSETTAKDVIQDVFLRLWLAREKLREIKVPKDYIFRVAYNQSFKHYHKLLRKEKAQQQLLEHEARKSNEPDTPAELLDLSQTKQLIEEAIVLLPAQSRRIYQLSRHSGHRPQEIAGQLGITVQAVRNSLTRSGQQIRDHLAKHGIIIPLVLASWCIR